MNVETVTIGITEWDLIQALERMILSLSNALENVDDDEVYDLFQRDMACLIVLRQELIEETETYNEKELPH